MQKRGKPLQNLKKVVGLLLTGEPLPGNYKDHELSSEWAGYRECHIDNDWLLIYRIDEGRLILIRTGTHSDLFG